MSTSYLVNGIYPLEYFTLPGTDQIVYSHEFWWSSKMRPATVGLNDTYLKDGIQTAEYLELDLSRVRQVNYINFSVIRAPLDITIEYDAVSDDDAGHRWVEVTPAADELFDHQIHYTAKHRNAWFDAEYYFTDGHGRAVNTRFLRIKFARRDVEWPHKDARPFRWAVMVKNLHSARFISAYDDTLGTLFDALSAKESTGQAVLMDLSAADYANEGSTDSGWVCQQFSWPADAQRGSINPSLLGFSVLFFTEPNAPVQEFLDTPNESLVRIQWKLYDATDRSHSILLKSGITEQALTDREGWVNVYFDTDEAISWDGTPTVYEVRAKSLSVHVDPGDALGIRQIMGKVITTDQNVPGLALAGTATLTNASATVTMSEAATLAQNGDILQRADRIDTQSVVTSVSGVTITLDAPYEGESAEGVKLMRVLPMRNGLSGAENFASSLALRVWADVGDSGRDVLGNTYRYGTHVDAPAQVFDNDKVGWMSDAQPATDAVESLYFDTRFTNVEGDIEGAVIDAIRIAPRTPGVFMHVYYTEDGINGDAPRNTRQWNRLLWTPIHTTYVLNGRQTFTLPRSIRAAFVKLEFTRLQPRPIHIPARPRSPFVEYRRYPTWIETQFDNATVRRVVEDWFHNAAQKGLVKVDVLKTLRDPILEFQYKEREFLAALATNTKLTKEARNSGLINTTTNTFIDPVTASKINVNTTRMYHSPLTLVTDRDSVLGQIIANQTDPRTLGSVREGGFETARTISSVSTTQGRVAESFAHLTQTPMWFNRVARHIYKVDKAKFGKQAFYVGIQSVEFLRKDYTIARDDALITENLFDNNQLEQNTWIRDNPSAIAARVGFSSTLLSPSISPVDLLVSYEIDDRTIVDEGMQFAYLNQTHQLQEAGTTQAINIEVYQDNNGSRGALYSLNKDYMLSFTTDPDSGLLVNTMRIA